MIDKKVFMVSLLIALIVFITVADLDAFQIQREILAESQKLQRLERELARFWQLAEDRKVINQLYEDNMYPELRRRFNELSESIDQAYMVEDILALEIKHTEMRYLFRGISIVEDLYLFYDALYHYFIGDISETLDKMGEIINNYPGSDRIRPTVELSQTIFLVTGSNNEYIELFHKFPQLKTVKSHYWLGQAYYNLGSYDEAAEVFGETKKDNQFGIRSEMMLGMIAFANYQKDNALRIFARLLENYDRDEQYYDFAVLALARIYAQVGFFENSLILYDEYEILKRGNLTTDFVYEKALVEKKAGNTDQAIGLLSQIVNLPYTSSLFDKALAQIAVIQGEQSGIQVAKEILDDAEQINVAFIDVMNLRTERLFNLTDSVQALLQASAAKEQHKTNIEAKFRQIDAIEKRQEAIGDFGIDKYELDVIDIVTEEYSLLMKTVVDIDELIDLIAVQSNEKKAQSVADQIPEMDSLRVDLLTILFLRNMTIDDVEEWNKILQPASFGRRIILMTEHNEKIVTNYNEARRISRMIVELENILKELIDRGAAATDITRVQSAIDLLYIDAESRYGEINRSDDYVIAIEEELDAIVAFKDQLSEMEKLVALNYHQRLSERLARLNEAIFEDSDYVHTFSINKIINFVNDLEDINLEYNNALLQLQFKKILKLSQASEEVDSGIEEALPSEDL